MSEKVQSSCTDFGGGGLGIENLRHLAYRHDSESFYIRPGGCAYTMSEHFLLRVLEVIGERAMSAALRDLYLSNTSSRALRTGAVGQPLGEEAVYDTFLKHSPADKKEEFRNLYRRLHGGQYAFSDTDFSDDHGDQIQTATVIEVGKSMDGTLDYMFDFDFFRFQAKGGRKYRMNVNHESLRFSSLNLYDPKGLSLEELSLRTRSGWPLWKSRTQVSSGPQILWVAPSSQEYYLAVRNFSGKTGRYTLTIASHTAPVEDHGDTAATATNILEGEVVQGTMNDDFDYDYFRIQTEEGEKYKTVVTNGDFLRLRWYLSDGVTPADYDEERNEWRGHSRISEWVASRSGNYYLAVDSTYGETGTYTVTFTQVEDNPPERRPDHRLAATAPLRHPRSTSPRSSLSTLPGASRLPPTLPSTTLVRRPRTRYHPCKHREKPSGTTVMASFSWRVGPRPRGFSLLTISGLCRPRVMAGARGSRTHRPDRRAGANGVEVREAHRDPSAPVPLTYRCYGRFMRVSLTGRPASAPAAGC